MPGRPSDAHCKQQHKRSPPAHQRGVARQNSKVYTHRKKDSKGGDVERGSIQRTALVGQSVGVLCRGVGRITSLLQSLTVSGLSHKRKRAANHAALCIRYVRVVMRFACCLSIPDACRTDELCVLLLLLLLLLLFSTAQKQAPCRGLEPAAAAMLFVLTSMKLTVCLPVHQQRSPPPRRSRTRQ